MRLKTYKTNYLLWFVFGLVYFLFWGVRLNFFSELSTGSLRFSELVSFDTIGSLLFAIVGGWLFQCLVAIIWRRKKPNPPP
jgi:hypothetical protein